MIPLLEPHLGGNEARYVRECLDSGYVSSVGPFVERFEREFAAYVGSRYAVACASGTAALHVALRLAGALTGSLVAVSDFTFIASANAITYTGAEPLLVDSEPRTWNMDGELLHDEVTRRARLGERIPDVIEIVHILGHPAEMDALLDLRDRYGITIVEDAAESLGARYTRGPLAGRHVGTIGTLGCFSFNGNKIITTGGGGMITTDDPDLATRARHLTTQAKLPGPGYHHDQIGYNYRLSNIAAALGVAQLEQLPAFLNAKRAIAATYDRVLADLPVTLPPRAPWAAPSFWLYSTILHSAPEARDWILHDLAIHGIQARPMWPPLHSQRPHTSARRLGGPMADQLFQSSLSLPSSTPLAPRQQATLAAHLRDSFFTLFDFHGAGAGPWRPPLMATGSRPV